MSLDTSLRAAERAGDWRAQVVHLRRAGRYLEAANVVEVERERLRAEVASLDTAARNERLSGATVHPVSRRVVRLLSDLSALGVLGQSLQDEHRLASSWQVRCPECGDERATTVEEPSCHPCAVDGQWVRMLPVEQCPAPTAKPRRARRRSR